MRLFPPVTFGIGSFWCGGGGGGGGRGGDQIKTLSQIILISFLLIKINMLYSRTVSLPSCGV